MGNAAPADWSPIGPDGGRVDALAVDPLDPAVVLAGGDHAGVFRSTDGGAHWTPSRAGLPSSYAGFEARLGYAAVTQLAYPPDDDGTVYAATDEGEVFRSDDAGASWARKLGPFNTVKFEDIRIRRIAVAPGDPQHVYVVRDDTGSLDLLASDDGMDTSHEVVPPVRAIADVVVTRGGRLVVSSPTAIVYSDDGGTSFHDAATPAGAGRLELDPRTGTLYGLGNPGSVLRSDDGGKTWTAVSAPDTSGSCAYPPAARRTIVCSGPEGFVVSSDGGASWSAGPSLPDAASDPVATSSDILLAAPEGVLRAASAAGPWAPSDTGLHGVSAAVTVVDPARPGTLHVTDRYTPFVHTSTDGGASWTTSAVPNTLEVDDLVADPSHPSTLWEIGFPGGVYRSTDGGLTWQHRGDPDGTAIAIDPSDSDVLYALGGDDPGSAGDQAPLWRTEDAGRTWVPIGDLPSAGGLAFSMVVLPTTPLTLLLDDGLERSTDGGAHFTSTGRRFDGIGVDPSDASHLLAVGIDGLLYESADAGGAWSAVPGGLPVRGAGTPVFDPASPNVVYLPLPNPRQPHPTLYRSVDGGGSWSVFEAQLDGQPVGAITAVAGGLYAAAANGSLYHREVADTDPPVIRAAPQVRLAVGGTVGTHVPAVVSWQGVDAGSGIASYELQHRLGAAGDWGDVALSPPNATSRSVSLTRNAAHTFQVRATDGAGNTSAFRAGQRVFLGLREDSALTFGSRWSLERSSSWLGGTTHHASRIGSTFTFSFTGSDVAWVGAVGPARGSATVYLDGVEAGTVSAHATAFAPRRVLFTHAFETDGEHSIQIVVAGTAGHPRVDVDAFLTLQ